jgi:hypothetical protein
LSLHVFNLTHAAFSIPAFHQLKCRNKLFLLDHCCQEPTVSSILTTWDLSWFSSHLAWPLRAFVWTIIPSFLVSQITALSCFSYFIGHSF